MATEVSVSDASAPPFANKTALGLMDSAEGKIGLAHWWLTAEKRDEEAAVDKIHEAIADLVAAEHAITTSWAHELRRPVDVTEALAGRDA